MRQQWQLWTSALTKDKCNAIKELCETYPAVDGAIFANNTEDTSVRRSKVRWIYDSSISDLLHGYATHANRNAFGVDIDRPYEVQYTEYYSENKGFYDWHHDVDWENQRPFDRKLTVIVQLDDPSEYEGGEFNFKTTSNPDFRPQGSVLVFPSYLEHRVTPVTSGSRHSLVTWIEGPRWK
jgi:PKHD-type hydroxylase